MPYARTKRALESLQPRRGVRHRLTSPESTEVDGEATMVTVLCEIVNGALYCGPAIVDATGVLVAWVL